MKSEDAACLVGFIGGFGIGSVIILSLLIIFEVEARECFEIEAVETGNAQWVIEGHEKKFQWLNQPPESETE